MKNIRSAYIAPEMLKLNYKKPELKMIDGSYSSKYVVQDSITGDSVDVPYDYSVSVLNSPLYRNIQFLGYARLAMLLGNPLLNRFCSLLADDCTREWIELKSKSGEDKTEYIKTLSNVLEQYKVRELINKAMYFTQAYGGCGVAIRLHGDEDDLGNPLIIDSIKINQGDLDEFVLVEPYYIVPTTYNATDPLRSDFYQPRYLVCMGQTLHASRMMRMVSHEVPVQLKPNFNFFGIPPMQMILSYVEDFDQLRQLVVQLVNRMNVNVVKTNLDEVFDDADGSGIGGMHQRIKNMTAEMNNFGALIVDKETEDFSQISMSLQHVDEVLNQYAELMCIPAGIPATKWLGSSPKGFNATGTHDMKNYYDRISATQEQVIQPILDKIIKVIQLSTFGYVDEDITYSFNPLEQQNELEQSQILKNKADRDVAYIGAEVLTSSDIARKLANDPDSGYSHIDLEAIEMQKSLDDEVDDIDNEPLID